MINKEDKYRNELFDLLKDDISRNIEDEDLLNLIRNIFESDDNDIDNQEIINKLTKL